MTVVVTHSTPSDASFSTTGATAWDATHTLSGVGTMAEQNANAVAITGGSINGTTVGVTTPTTGAFTYASFPSQSVAPATPATGFTQYAASTGMFSWKGTNGFIRQFDASGITADRTWVLPNTAGTIALTSNLGTIASQNSNSVAITGGSIDGTTVGATTASTGAFTTLSASSTVSGTGFSTYLASPPTIGGTAAAAGTFTTLTGTTSTTTPIVQNSAAAAIAFKTNSATSAITQFNIAHTASAVNYVQVTGAVTGVAPVISSQGSDAAVPISFTTKSTGSYRFYSSSQSYTQVRIDGSISAVNYLDFYGSVASSAPSFRVGGSDTDIQLSLVPKGLGIVLTNQQTPAAVTATGTLTIANLLTQIITSTSAIAVALTLPTGTLSDAGVSGGTSAVNTSFDYSIINLGSAVGDVTMVAGTGHTIVGSVTVAVGTTGRFRCRKTATNTFVSYRV